MNITQAAKLVVPGAVEDVAAAAVRHPYKALAIYFVVTTFAAVKYIEVVGHVWEGTARRAPARLAALKEKVHAWSAPAQAGPVSEPAYMADYMSRMREAARPPSKDA